MTQSVRERVMARVDNIGREITEDDALAWMRGTDSAAFIHGAAYALSSPALSKAVEALKWYEYEAQAIAKNLAGTKPENISEGSHAHNAIFASLTVLSLDAGRRAREAYESLEAMKG